MCELVHNNGASGRPAVCFFKKLTELRPVELYGPTDPKLLGRGDVRGRDRPSQSRNVAL